MRAARNHAVLLGNLLAGDVARDTTVTYTNTLVLIAIVAAIAFILAGAKFVKALKGGGNNSGVYHGSHTTMSGQHQEPGNEIDLFRR